MAKPVHIMRWAPQDWHSSSLRGELALERDHLSRMVYLELLGKLHEAGGQMRREEVAGACLVSSDEAEHALKRLIRSGRIVDVDGHVSNPRVCRGLTAEEEFREEQSKRGRSGGLAKAKHSLNPPAPLPTPTPIHPERERALDSSEPTAPGVSLRAEYAKAVWDAFSEKRGREVEISVAEWDCACSWYEAGIPLRVVLRAIQDCDVSKARSMLYLKPAVEAEVARVAAARYS